MTLIDQLAVVAVADQLAQPAAALDPQAAAALDLRLAEVDRGSNANQITIWVANLTANLQDALEQNKPQVAHQGRTIVIDSRSRDCANWLPVDFATR